MLMDLSQLAAIYNINDFTSVIHVGAHHGQEIGVYQSLGFKYVLAFEPQEESFKILQENMKDYSNVFCYNFAIGNAVGSAKLNIASNDQSSSILKPKKHLELHKDVLFDGTTQDVAVVTLDYFMERNFPFIGFNTLNIDVQGFELQVLQGAKELLNTIRYVYVEVNKDEVYEGCGMVEEIDSLLALYNIVRVETDWAGGLWGDAFYIKLEK
jgi:FkbM family methyltransferase